MHGPTAATMRRGSAPREAMASTVASRTPPSAPFQPAWAPPTTIACGSANSTGAQSAVRMPRAMFGRSVTIASARGKSFGCQGASTTNASALCT